MKKVIVSLMVAGLGAATALAAPYTGPWSQTWDFNNGAQGWTQVQNTNGFWVDPAVYPTGPSLPDGGTSGAGGGNIYAPDGSRWQISITPTDRWIIQVDAYLPNLMPLNINTYVPGNGLQNAGVGAITAAENKHMYVVGRNPDGAMIRDRSWDNTDRTRSWLFEEAGVAKADMWDDWVTMQFSYNWDNDGKFTGAVYTPWDSGVHDGPGWFEFAKYDIHPTVANRAVDRLILGSVVPGTNSWTQAQFDNVKFVPEPAALALLGLALPMLRRRR